MPLELASPMTMAEWRYEMGQNTAVPELPAYDLGNQSPINPAEKCPHGQYNADYCGLCNADFRYDPGYKLHSESSRVYPQRSGPTPKWLKRSSAEHKAEYAGGYTEWGRRVRSVEIEAQSEWYTVKKSPRPNEIPRATVLGPAQGTLPDWLRVFFHPNFVYTEKDYLAAFLYLDFGKIARLHSMPDHQPFSYTTAPALRRYEPHANLAFSPFYRWVRGFRRLGRATKKTQVNAAYSLWRYAGGPHWTRLDIEGRRINVAFGPPPRLDVYYNPSVARGPLLYPPVVVACNGKSSALAVKDVGGACDPVHDSLRRITKRDIKSYKNWFEFLPTWKTIMVHRDRIRWSHRDMNWSARSLAENRATFKITLPELADLWGCSERTAWARRRGIVGCVCRVCLGARLPEFRRVRRRRAAGRRFLRFAESAFG